MGIADSTFWWLLAGTCIVLELVTGTFFLLTVVQNGSAPPQAGLHRVVAVVGNRLMVDKA
jgi:hypothetical protein